MKLTKLILVITLFNLSIISPAICEEKDFKSDIFFYELKDLSKQNDQKTQIVEDLILSEFFKYKSITVLSKKEIKEVLNADAFRELLDCESQNCIAELSKSVGTENLLYGEMSFFKNDKAILFLEILNSHNGQSKFRASKSIDLDSEKMMDQVKSMVKYMAHEFDPKAVPKIDYKDEEKTFTGKNILYLSGGLILGGLGGYLLAKSL